MVHDNFQLRAFDLIDEHTVGFVGYDGVGTVDIRMMREEYIHKVSRKTINFNLEFFLIDPDRICFVRNQSSLLYTN